MFNPEKKIGASLLVMGLMLNVNEAFAQTTPTCVKAPTCEELGYDKVASDCGELAKLRCPFDPDKYFCTAYTDMNGSKLAEIGDFVYVDAISAEPISGRIPVGIVYDKSGKMMSLAQFTGQTADQCNSYTTDGTAGWKLAAMEDMGLIKSNVDKINASLAKIPNVPKIETDFGHTHGDRYWWTSDSKTACMIKGVAINDGRGSLSGCYDLYQDRQHEAEHALCIRTFSAGGAGKDPAQEKPTTYKVGDVYTNDEGVAIGTVFEIDSGGTHGRILSRTSRTGTQAEAIEYCDSLNASTGLTWSLPTYQQIVKICKNEITGFALSTYYWISESSSVYRSPSESCNYSYTYVNPEENYSYFCATSF